MVVDHTPSISGTYPNLKWRIDFSFKIRISGWGAWQYRGTKLKFGSKETTINLDVNLPNGGDSGVLWQDYITGDFSTNDRSVVKNNTASITSIINASGTCSDTCAVPYPSVYSVSKPTSISATSAVVPYELSPNNYKYWRGQLTDGSKTWSLPDPTGKSTYTLTGLAPNKKYEVAMTILDRNGNAIRTGTAVSFTTPKPSAPTFDSVTASDIGMYGATINIGNAKAGSGASLKSVVLMIDGKSTTHNYNARISLTGLTPNKKYTVTAKVVDNFGTSSSTRQVTFTTPKPSAPTFDSVSVTNIGITTATVKINGAKAGLGGTLKSVKLEYGGKTKTVNYATSINLNDLTEQTEYTLKATLIDNFGSSSSTKQTTFETLPDALRVWLKHEGKIVIAKVFVKREGVIKKIVKGFSKQNGFIVVSKNARR